MSDYLTEFIGTFFLVLTVGLTSVDGTLLAPLAIGCCLMVMVYMGGHVSGAHYNPAVSFAFLLRGKMTSFAQFCGYVLSQCMGGTFAALVVYALTRQTFAPAPVADATVASAVVVEMLFTFALALVVLNTAGSPATKGNSYYGLAIGFTVVVGGFAGGPISGGAFNPAVGFGPIVVQTMLGEGTLANLWIYLAGPLVGGAVAAAVFGLQEGEPIASPRPAATRSVAHRY